MSIKTKSRWQGMRTSETRKVETTLRNEFPATDAYRYNSASIRVRVVDPRFKGKTAARRAAMVEQLLSKLEDETQADIMNLLTLYPGEPDDSPIAAYRNMEFEEPSPSIL